MLTPLIEQETNLLNRKFLTHDVNGIVYAISCNNLKCDQVMLLSLNKKYDSENINIRL